MVQGMGVRAVKEVRAMVGTQGWVPLSGWPMTSKGSEGQGVQQLVWGRSASSSSGF